MARMHSRRKGKAKSTKPIHKSTPSWVRYKDKEVEMIVTKLAKEGKSPSQIGLILRDSYGIPDIKTLIGESITQIMEKKDVASKMPADMTDLIKKAIAVRKHLEENGQDKTAKRGLILTESKIKRLAKYYKANKKLEEDWRYQPEKIRLMLE